MPRRDGGRTVGENAQRDANAVTLTITDWAKDHGYYGEAALNYAVVLVETVLQEMLKPKNLVHLMEPPKEKNGPSNTEAD